MTAFGAFAERAVFAAAFLGARVTFEVFLEAFLAVFLDVLDFAFEIRLTALLTFDRPNAGFPGFLRVFLDIRLPFVAFCGSLTVIAAGFFACARIRSAAGQI